MVVGMRIGRTTRHALVVEAVQVQRIRTRHARVLSRATARPAALVARLAGLRGRLVVL